MATAVEWAWAAGLFEGEGCIVIQSRHVRLKVKMTDEDTVRRFHSVVGCGTVIYGERERSHWKDTWLWSVYPAQEVKTVIEAMLPHLGQRRQAKAQECLAVIAQREQARVARTPVCGTPGGYHRHWRAGEKACVACLQALNDQRNGRSCLPR